MPPPCRCVPNAACCVCPSASVRRELQAPRGPSLGGVLEFGMEPAPAEGWDSNSNLAAPPFSPVRVLSPLSATSLATSRVFLRGVPMPNTHASTPFLVRGARPSRFFYPLHFGSEKRPISPIPTTGRRPLQRRPPPGGRRWHSVELCSAAAGHRPFAADLQTQAAAALRDKQACYVRSMQLPPPGSHAPIFAKHPAGGQRNETSHGKSTREAGANPTTANTA